MGFTDFGKKKILGCCFLGEAAPKMFLAAFLKSSEGLEEIKGNGYERVSLSNDILSIDSEGVLTNSEDLIFPLAKKGWGVISALAIVNTEGEQLFIEKVNDPTPKMAEGKRLRIPKGMLSIQLQD